MKNKFLGIICLLFAGIIIYVWYTDSLKNYLAPNMHIYLKVSAVALIIIGLIILLSEFHYKFKVLDLVLFLPLIILIIAGDGRLSTSFASNRSSNIAAKKVSKTETKKEEKKDETKEDKKEEPVEDSKQEYDFSNPFFDIQDDNYQDLANYLTFNQNALEYDGKTIRVRGFISNQSEYLPSGYVGLGKYGVSCCTADASFTGFIITVDNKDIKENSWYEIEGVFEKATTNVGESFLSIKIINIKEIESSSEEQYVYACYTYGDGSCSSVKKYNLKYR